MKSLNRWVYAIFGVIALLMAGLVYAWSVMSKPIGAAHTDWTAAQLSLTFTLVMVFFCLGGLIAGILSKKIPTRIFIILAGILFIIGFFIAAMAGDSPALLYLGFGIICGLGAGFAYTPVMGTVSAWFPDKQGLISGILLMGFGLSSFIVGKVYTAYTPADGSDGWQATFRVIGIIVVIVLVICSIFLVKPDAGYKPKAVEDSSKKKEVREPASEKTPGEMLRHPSFWCYYIWAIVISGAGLALVSQGSGIATEVGPTVSAGTIATVVGLISIFNGIGRVIFGGIFDKKGHKFTMILDMIVFIIAALIIIASLATGSFTILTIGFIVGGIAYGGVTPTNSAIISDFFGRTNYPTNFSLINTNLIIASFASTIAGKLYDSSQSYFTTMIMMIILTVVGFVVFFGVRRPKN
ncbi:MAG: MFS transporter [Eubacterium sp.]|nr:MFS transporter [Eubacterium sp.]